MTGRVQFFDHIEGRAYKDEPITVGRSHYEQLKRDAAERDRLAKAIHAELRLDTLSPSGRERLTEALSGTEPPRSSHTAPVDGQGVEGSVPLESSHGSEDTDGR